MLPVVSLLPVSIIVMLNLDSSFVFQSYMKTFMKLKLKKEKISDVEKALRSGSGELEFKDFRETLKE